MTNILATIVLSLSTNWGTIGTFTATGSTNSQVVQRGNIATNIQVVVEWGGRRRAFLLESHRGPSENYRFMPKPEPRKVTTTNTAAHIIITNATIPKRIIAPKDKQ